MGVRLLSAGIVHLMRIMLSIVLAGKIIIEENCVTCIIIMCLLLGKISLALAASALSGLEVSIQLNDFH